MSYFDKQYAQDKQEIESIDRLLNGVWKTLANCITPEGVWPYDITDGKHISVDNFSVSTQAMVHFSLEIAKRGLPFHEFSCKKPAGYRVPKAPSLDRQTLKDITTAIEASRRKLTAVPNLAGDIARGTFGELNPFTLSWLIPISTASSSSEQLFALAKQSLHQAERHRDGSISILKLNDAYEVSTHAFPVLRALQLYRMLKDAGKSISAEAHGTFSSGSLGEWFYSRLLDHLAFATIKDGPFDAAELAFSLEGYLLCRPQLADGCNHDRDAIDRAFEVLERRQEITPYWRPLKPLLTNKRGFALLPLSVEIVNSLFRSCWILGTRGDLLFSKHIQIFHHYYQWIESRVTGGTFSPAIGQKVDRRFLGWHSEHLAVKDGIHTWETSQVGIYLIHYRSMLQRHVAAQCVFATGLKYQRPSIGADSNARDVQSLSTYWKSEFQDKFSPRPNHADDVYKQIGEYFIAPRERTSDQGSGNASDAHYSMVLYGPPGTGKTTIAQAVAKALGWDFISLSPSDFVQTGVSQVEQRAKRIFEALTEQENCVILLDEIDRLILDRNLKAYDNQDDMFQMMTPSMLPKLKELREKESSIFVIATNYFERIERAAVRAGRVDDAFLVGLPDFEARKAILYAQLRSQLQKAEPRLVRSKDDAIAKITAWDSDMSSHETAADEIRNQIGFVDKALSTPESIFKTSIDDLAAMSPLASFSELKQLVERTVSTLLAGVELHLKNLLTKSDVESYLKDFNRETLDLKRCFEEQVKRMVFDVRLSNYKSRVTVKEEDKKDPSRIAALENPPTEELLDVIWLKVEVRQKEQNQNEAKLIRSLLTDLLTRLCGTHVTDEKLNSEFKTRCSDDQIFLRMKRQVDRISDYLEGK